MALRTVMQNVFRSVDRSLWYFFNQHQHPRLALNVSQGNWYDDGLDGDRVDADDAAIEESVWFAVPKSKVSRSKKRIKNYLKRTALKQKSNIIVDGRTGEYTLKHHLPVRWKDYLPDESIKAFTWDDFLPEAQARICKTKPIHKKNRARFKSSRV